MDYSLKTVNKALDILEQLSIKSEDSLTSLYKTMDMPKTTIFRLVNTLEKRGYILKNSSGSLSLGPRVMGLVSSTLRSGWIAELNKTAHPYMVDLRDLYEDTVNLAIRIGDNLIYIDVVEGTYAMRFVELPGAIGSLHATALGKTLLAYLDPIELKNILKRLTFEKLTPSTIDNPDDFLYELQLTKKQGFALDCEGAVIGGSCIAVPILSDGKKPIAALSIASARARMLDARMESMKLSLMDACRNIEDILYVKKFAF